MSIFQRCSSIQPMGTWGASTRGPTARTAAFWKSSPGSGAHSSRMLAASSGCSTAYRQPSRLACTKRCTSSGSARSSGLRASTRPSYPPTP